MTASEMKKFIFSFFSCLLFLPVVFLTACREELPVIDDDYYYVPPIEEVYSEDWRYITVFLGDKPIMINSSVSKTPAGRAMTRDTARLAFNYFGVVFCYTFEDGTQRVARSSWQIGKEDGEEEEGNREDDKGAVVFNVYRTSSGVDYSAGAAEKGKGAALLFAGRRFGGPTLLGAGRVYSVDDVEGAVITDQSSYVTFELSAITGSVSVTPGESSFKTASKDSPDYLDVRAEKTDVVNALIRQNPFPLYRLPYVSGRKVAAQYEFGFDNREWSYYGGGIVIAEPNESLDQYSAMTREVRYPAGSGKYWYPTYKIDQTTHVDMENNKKERAGLPVENPVTFLFDTSKTDNIKKTDNGIFTLVFRIPVYALTNQTGNERWFLETGYQSYRYNIDNGKDSTGSGVFMGVDAPPDLELDAVRR